MRFAPMILQALGSLALLALLAPGAEAWGAKGHLIVARIADEYLTPAARRGIRDLIGQRLGAPPTAVWPDQIRRNRDMARKYPHHTKWHFIDLPVGEPKAWPALFADDDQVIAATARFRAKLADRQADKQTRVEALRFVTHFIGDMHQPLHCADRGDRGGNAVKVVLHGDRRHTVNLHHAWDTDLVDIAVDDMDAADAATRLAHAIRAEDLKAWQQGTLEEWALESHKLAETVAYRNVPRKGKGAKTHLGPDYIDRGAATVKVQLQRGGVRLARILNEVFADAAQH